MTIDDSIVQRYLHGEATESYSGCWIYCALGGGRRFEEPDPANRGWVSLLCAKLRDQIPNYVPRNESVVRSLIPEFESIAREYTIMLVVGFPDPYDAMVLEHDGKEYLVFDLVQFGSESLSDEYSCHRVLTHELIHMCLHRMFPIPKDPSYIEELDYTTFNEGFAHALPYSDDWASFELNGFMREKYNESRRKLSGALQETDAARQKECRLSADEGDYWDKYASIGGKLYLLRHKEDIAQILRSGWRGFASDVVNDRCRCGDRP